VSTSGSLKPEPDFVRVLGIFTAIGLAALVLANHALSGFAAGIVGALAIFMIIGAGSQFLFHGATIVSTRLEGRRRTQFQVAVSFAAPIAFTLYLASRADTVPIETLWGILTPWLLVPLCLISWICWFAGAQLDREHPFRGFLIAATVLFVLCWMWSAGMVHESDGEDTGGWYLDPKKANRAKETGEYVWRYILYVTIAYLALFLRRGSTQLVSIPEIVDPSGPTGKASDDAVVIRWLRRLFRPRSLNVGATIRQAYISMSPDVARQVVATVGGFVADRHGRPSRESDLPLPKLMIEFAFIKALREWPEGPQLETLKTFYVGLDSYSLTDEECKLLTRWNDLILSDSRIAPDTDASSPESRALLDELMDDQSKRAVELQKRLTEKAEDRFKLIQKLRSR